MELLVVLMLLAIIVAVSVPATGRFLESIERKKKDQAIMATLRYARLMAITNGKPVSVAGGDDAVSLQLAGAVEETRSFPLDDGETLSLEPAEITFFPEGFATPAQVTLAGERRTVEIFIDPLTALPQVH